MISELITLCEALGCQYLTDEPMKSHTTFKIGGLCDILIYAKDIDSLTKIVNACTDSDIKYSVIGRGSNLIVPDCGYRGAVIILSEKLCEISMLDEYTISVGAGASMSSLCIFALENSLTGIEFAYGIPGTVGGGLYMNAGAYGGELSDIVISAEYLENGEIHSAQKDKMELSYRHSMFSHNTKIITRAVFKLEKGRKEDIKFRMDDLMQRRKSKQPLDMPSAGSTFKRPEGCYASLLIEQCGLKGRCVGGAQVSEKHSGFIVNKGSASCEDILSLAAIVRSEVKSRTGYDLELEPEILK